MTVNMKLILVCLVANVIFCNGLPQGYCQPDFDAYEMAECDEVGDALEQPWSYGRMRDAEPYHHLSMLGNDEEYYESPGRFMNRANKQLQSGSSSYMHRNFAPSSRDSLMGLNYEQNPMSHDSMRFAKSAQMQPFAYPGHHYHKALSAYDEPSYFHPMDYYDGYSPDEHMDEYDDCTSGKCPRIHSVGENEQARGRKLRKNHDKRHNTNAEKMSSKKMANKGRMIHHDEIDVENVDKDSWGISRREKQKNKEQEAMEDNLKGKRSVEKENIEHLKEKQESLERTKKDVKQVNTENIGENVAEKKTFVHQVMHIPRKI